MFRDKIFQTIFLVFQPVLCHFLILVGAHDEPSDLPFFLHCKKTRTHIPKHFIGVDIPLVHANLHIGMYYNGLHSLFP